MWRFSPWVEGIVLVLVLIVGFTWILGSSADESAATLDAPYPGAIQEPLLVAGVEVVRPWVDVGHVPLDTPVQHFYTLRNTGSVPVTFGDASIRVLEGC